MKSTYTIAVKVTEDVPAPKADIQAFRNVMSVCDHMEFSRLCNLLIDAQVIQLAEVKERAGLSGADLQKMLHWDVTQISRTLNPAMNLTLTFGVWPRLATICGISMTEFAFGHNCLPLVIPNKHLAWIKAIQKMRYNEKIKLANAILENFEQVGEPDYYKDYSGLIYERINEMAQAHGNHFRQLIKPEYKKSASWLRSAIDTAAKEKKYLGRVPSMYYLAVNFNCAIDYFGYRDYSDFTGKITDINGTEVMLDEGTRKVMSAILCCKNEDAVNRLIGVLCATQKNPF